jgi:holo-[acyl-carrier protein] synthase
LISCGIDLVRVSRIEESLAQFGERFLRRIYTDGEVAYARSAPALTSERLAARFAAKEAALKALGLAGRGVGWRDIEVVAGEGGPSLRLHGAAALAGPREIAVSLSHEGDFATAIVVTTGDLSR